MAYPVAEDYKNTVVIPERPEEPRVLRRTARELSADEINALPQIKADYDAAKEAHAAARRAYRDEDDRLEDKLKADLAAAEGITGHKHADKVWKMAWERADKNIADTIEYYGELAELLK